jgi:hypothetical protein
MNIGLIVIGDEILSGKRADKHMAKVIEMLSDTSNRGRFTPTTHIFSRQGQKLKNR